MGYIFIKTSQLAENPPLRVCEEAWEITDAEPSIWKDDDDEDEDEDEDEHDEEEEEENDDDDNNGHEREEEKIMMQTSLPIDMIHEILLRLSVKPLSKFRCVSKSWCTLISDANFIQSHHCRSAKNPLFLMMSATPGNGEAKFYSIDIDGNVIRKFARSVPPGIYMLYLACTCTDLVCVYGPMHALLLNPATEEFTFLPPCKAYSSGYTVQELVIGYAPSTNKYKVLRVFYNHNHIDASCEVFTLGSDRNWRGVGGPPFQVNAEHCACIDGSIHMASKRNFDKKLLGVARFDLDKEGWSVLRPPDCTTGDYCWCGRLVALEGRVCLTNVDLLHLDLWLLNDTDKGVWVKEYSIDISIWKTYPWYWHADIVPLAIAGGGRILTELPNGRLLHYDLKTKKFEDTKFEYGKGLVKCRYIESFVPLETIM